MTQFAMIIDLRKCVGCGACALACKTENNTALRKNGQTHNWADFVHETTGKFPDTGYRTMPVLCNHCSNAPCVEACPVEPKAMFKTPDGITMHNDERCIGCRSCQEACPYSMEEVKKDIEQQQADNDVIQALESLKNAFNTDVTPIMAMARFRSQAAVDPLALYRKSSYRQYKGQERPVSASDGGGIV